jgi:hypothetical protein
MSDERNSKSQPHVELSDTDLDQISGGHGDGQQPVPPPNATANGDDKKQENKLQDSQVDSYSWHVSNPG